MKTAFCPGGDIAAHVAFRYPTQNTHVAFRRPTHGMLGMNCVGASTQDPCMSILLRVAVHEGGVEVRIQSVEIHMVVLWQFLGPISGFTSFASYRFVSTNNAVHAPKCITFGLVPGRAWPCQMNGRDRNPWNETSAATVFIFVVFFTERIADMGIILYDNPGYRCHGHL